MQSTVAVCVKNHDFLQSFKKKTQLIFYHIFCLVRTLTRFFRWFLTPVPFQVKVRDGQSLFTVRAVGRYDIIVDDTILKGRYYSAFGGTLTTSTRGSLLTDNHVLNRTYDPRYYSLS